MAPGKSLDKLTLAGVKLHPRIGVSPGEKRFPQPCQADVALWGDFAAAAAADSLERAVNYSRVLATVLETAHAREYNLLETLAYRIARDLLDSYAVARVRVRLRKRPASLVAKLEFVEVEVEAACRPRVRIDPPGK